MVENQIALEEDVIALQVAPVNEFVPACSAPSSTPMPYANSGATALIQSPKHTPGFIANSPVNSYEAMRALLGWNCRQTVVHGVGCLIGWRALG
jgi:hypothetical protein